MNIVRGTPPNFEDIAAVFPLARRTGTIFTYGDTVYVNGEPELSPALRAHEAKHVERQRLESGGPAAWWEQYLADQRFRLEEELLAHRAEYGTLRATVKDRNALAGHLNAIASRLAGPLYGSLLTVAEAKQRILR